MKKKKKEAKKVRKNLNSLKSLKNLPKSQNLKNMNARLFLQSPKNGFNLNLINKDLNQKFEDVYF